MINVDHIYGENENTNTLKKAFSALKPKGRLIVKNFILNPDGFGPVFSNLFSLKMFLSSENGRCHTKSELFDQIAHAGFDSGETYALTDVSFF